MKRKLKKAFTITELVIVIAVIAILAAVLIPTFSNVVDNSKKSHDTQYAKELNVALNNYTIEHRAAPEDYEELMLALSDSGLTDGANPFLLATTLKQDNAVLVWFPTANHIQLITTDEYTMIYEGTRGFGNGVGVYNKQSGDTKTFGYVLCNTGSSDSEFVASLYYDYYITCGGDISKFVKSGSANSKDFKDKMDNKTWANAIESAINNHTNGYTYSDSVANEIEETLKESASVDLSCLPTDAGITTESDFSKDLSPEQQVVVEQSVRSTLATVASMANDSQEKDNIAGKKISLKVPKGTVVDMSQTLPTAIGNQYRKDADIKSNPNAKSSVSVDFGGVTLKDMSVKQNEFVSTGAEWQDEKDNGYPGGGYAFVYGLFGTVVAKPGDQVVIENLNITGVNMNLTGAHETVDGQLQNTVADMAGIVVGYTHGDVLLRNIHIDGSEDGGLTKGVFNGYDAIGGFVGRSYGYKDSNKGANLKLENCSLKNIDIQGERRASGIVGYWSGNINCASGCTNGNLEINGVSLDNVSITALRHDANPQTWASVIAHHASANIDIKDLTLNNVTTLVKFAAETISSNSDEANWNTLCPGDSIKTIAYVKAKYEDGKNLLLLAGSKLNVTGKITVTYGGKTYTIGANEYTATTKQFAGPEDNKGTVVDNYVELVSAN